MREPVGSRGLGSLTAGGGPGVGWQAAEVGWGGRQWPLSDGMWSRGPAFRRALDCEFRVMHNKHDRQSPMKNLEVKFSLSELEFRCKNLFLIWEKHWEARI